VLAGAKATVKAIGLPEDYVEGKIFSADSHDHSAEHLQTCAQAKLDADIPDTHCRQRDARLATQERPKPPTDAKLTLGDCTYDQAHDTSMCPHGKLLTLAARRHKIEKNIYRR
jgi:hypothetical protein